MMKSIDAEEFWFDEEIAPSGANMDEVITRLSSDDGKELAAVLGQATLAAMSKGQRTTAAENFARDEVKGRVRVNRPRALPVVLPNIDDERSLRSAASFAHGRAYLIRLSVEYSLSEPLRTAKYRFRKVWCRTLVTAAEKFCAPHVLDVYPVRLYEGNPRRVNIEVKPTFRLAVAEFELGSVSGDVQVGLVAPATLGYLGENDRAPYWEMSEREHEILGRYHFWFLLDVPGECDLWSVKLAVLAEGDLRFHVAGIPLGPKHRWEDVQRWLSLAELLPPQFRN